MCINCQQNSNIFTPNGIQGFNGQYGGYSSAWLFDGSSISGNPANTFFQFNNTNISLVTTIYINKTNRDSNDLTGFLNSFINNGNYGNLRLFKEFDSTTFVDFNISAVSLSGSIFTLTVSYITNANSFSTNNGIVFSFSATGESSIPSYLVYTALISQSGSSDPTITTLHNTVGNIIWTRNNTGIYFGTLASAFPLSKTYIDIVNNQNSDNILIIRNAGTNSLIIIDTYDNTFTAQDGLLGNTPLEIRVYP